MGFLFEFTDHALEQFVSRFDTSLTREEAKDKLTFHAQHHSRRINTRTYSGQGQWHLPLLNIVMITKPTRRKLVVVTVIAAHHVLEVRQQQRIDAHVADVEVMQQEQVDQGLAPLGYVSPRCTLQLTLQIQYSVDADTFPYVIADKITEYLSNTLPKSFTPKKGKIEEAHISNTELTVEPAALPKKESA